MTIDQVLTHYGTQKAVAAKLGITQPSVAAWVRKGAVPQLRQIQIQKLSRGKLKADPV